MPKVGFVYKFLERGLCWKDEQFIRTSENDLFIVLSIKSRDERKTNSFVITCFSNLGLVDITEYNFINLMIEI